MWSWPPFCIHRTAQNAESFDGTHRLHNEVLCLTDLQYFYLYQIFYKTLVSTTKMSFIFLYIDLFPSPKFILICWAIQASILAATCAFVLGTIFQCTPLPYFWDRTIEGGHCIKSSAFWYSHAAWNSLFDLLIMILPITVIRSLQMAKKQKLAVIGMFSLGTL
jgi:hypothetical protein